MSGESFFLTMAQLGIGMGAIVSIVFALRQDSSRWVIQDILGMNIILELSFALVLFALAPFPLTAMFGSTPVVWRYASFGLASFFTAYLGLTFYRLWHMHKVRTYPRRRILAITSIIISIIIIFLQLNNASQWQTSTAYMVGLLWLLVGPGLQFFAFMSFFTAAIIPKAPENVSRHTNANASNDVTAAKVPVIKRANKK